MNAPRERRVALPYLTLAALEWGDPAAPPLVALHGWLDNAASFAALAPLLAPRYRTIALELPGHGHSGHLPAGAGYHHLDHVRAVLAALDALELPRCSLLGHSLGSFMAQQFITEHGDALAGVVLSGSGGRPKPLAVAGRLVARIERLRLGPRGRSPLLHALSFQAFNKQFAPTRTPYDWLSRDAAEIDKYVADPLCGTPASVQLWIDVLDALGDIAAARRQARIPKRLPIYVISGGRDAVNDNTRSLEQLLEAYRRAGLERVAHRFYPDARHELFNELNRDEVTRDLIGWLDAATAR